MAILVCLLSEETRSATIGDPPEVDLALVIAVDISTSMDAAEQQLQRDGYVGAFRHPDVVRAIASGPRGRIVVTYVEWAGPNIGRTVVPWTVIADADAAGTFAAALAAAPLGHAPGTSISSALFYAGRQFNRRDYRADRLAVDISGDGPNNAGQPVEMLRDWLVRRGVTINGLPIMLDPDEPDSGEELPGIDVYYEDCVIGGPGAFMIVIRDAAGFATAIRSKLMLEIAGPRSRPTTIATFVRPSRVDCRIGERAKPN